MYTCTSALHINSGVVIKDIWNKKQENYFSPLLKSVWNRNSRNICISFRNIGRIRNGFFLFFKNLLTSLNIVTAQIFQKSQASLIISLVFFKCLRPLLKISHSMHLRTVRLEKQSVIIIPCHSFALKFGERRTNFWILEFSLTRENV